MPVPVLLFSFIYFPMDQKFKSKNNSVGNSPTFCLVSTWELPIWQLSFGGCKSVLSKLYYYPSELYCCCQGEGRRPKRHNGAKLFLKEDSYFHDSIYFFHFHPFLLWIFRDFLMKTYKTYLRIRNSIVPSKRISPHCV